MMSQNKLQEKMKSLIVSYIQIKDMINQETRAKYVTLFTEAGKLIDYPFWKNYFDITKKMPKQQTAKAYIDKKTEIKEKRRVARKVKKLKSKDGF